MPVLHLIILPISLGFILVVVDFSRHPPPIGGISIYVGLKKKAKQSIIYGSKMERLLVEIQQTAILVLVSNQLGTGN